MTTQPQDVRYQLNQLILQAEHKLTQELAAFLKQHPGNMNPTSWKILECLSDEQGMAMSTLGISVHANDSTLTKIVDKMVKDSLVYRKADAKDRRKVLVFISKRGMTLYSKIKEPLNNHFEKVFPSKEEHLVDLVGGLQGLLNSNSEGLSSEI